MKTIQLSNGMLAKVDDADYPYLSLHRWHCRKGRQSCYAQTHVHVADRRTTKQMHQFLLSVPAGFETDHINGDGLDNQRLNLRLATKKQNQANRGKPVNGQTSRFKGVSYVKHPYRKRKPWRASIFVDGKTKNLGQYATEVEAAKAYNEQAQAAFGIFALLNNLTFNDKLVLSV